MRRAVIVDDEPKSAEVLKTLAEDFMEGIEIAGIAHNIEEAVELITRTKPDLALLDITLKEGDSFQILQRLDHIDFDVVFITAYDEYTVRALSYSGIHCLYKPIDLQEFEEILSRLDRQKEQTGEALEIARQLLQSKFTRIPVVTEKGLTYVTPGQINYVEACHGGSRIYFNDFTSLLTNKSLADLASVMEKSSFSHVKNEYLINLHNLAVEKTRPGKVIFLSGEELRLEAEEVLKLLKMVK